MADYVNASFTNKSDMSFIAGDTYSNCYFTRMENMTGVLTTAGPCYFASCTGDFAAMTLADGCDLRQSLLRVANPGYTTVGGITRESTVIEALGRLTITPGGLVDISNKSNLIRDAYSGKVYRYQESVVNYPNYTTCVFPGEFDTITLPLNYRDGFSGASILGVPATGNKRLTLFGLPTGGPTTSVTVHRPKYLPVSASGNSGSLSLDYAVMEADAVHTIVVRINSNVSSVSFGPY